MPYSTLSDFGKKLCPVIGLRFEQKSSLGQEESAKGKPLDM
jgi:hypothetical protein